MKTAVSERELIAQFLEALQSVPEVRAKWRSEPKFDNEWHWDAWIELQAPGKAADLFVEVKKNSYPRDVREVLWQLTRLVRTAKTKSGARETVPVLVSESISPGAKELLREERVGYFDSGGSLFLPARGLYIYVDRPPPKRFARSVRSLFSGRRAQVLHALLVWYESWFRVRDLAEVAEVSPATTSEVLIELERFEWVTSRGRGPHKQRRLEEPSKLLDAWADQVRQMRTPSMHRYYVPLTQPDELIQKIATVFAAREVEYAITGEAAGQRYAPFLTRLSRVHCRLAISPFSEAAIKALGARAVDAGANLVVVESRPGGDFLFREAKNGIQFASPIQVYLDLLHSAGRAKELAEHLRAEVIGF